MTSRKILFHFPYTTSRSHSSHHRRAMLSTMPLPHAPFLPKPPSVLATNIIKSYFDMGLLREARMLFDEMPDRDVVAWSAMISGYTSCSRHMDAWKVFCEMLCNSAAVQPNEFTFSSVLKACKGIGLVCCGSLVHGLALKHGVLGCVYVDNALMDMYATCCTDMDRACAVFEEIKVKSSVTWTSLIASYTHLGDGHGGLRMFRQMLLEGGELNPFTLSIAIRACSSIGSLSYGRQIHAMVVTNEFESNIPVMNSILDMYCRCADLSEAYRCFQGMMERDIITWNTMISGYVKSDPYEALNLYSGMEYKGLTPNCFTFTSVIAAVTNMALLGVGEQVHGRILKGGHGDNLVLANSLIDMYAKSGSILNSCKIFNEMRSRNVVSWTSMIIGYGNHGHGKLAVELFDKMIQSGVRPDWCVFVAVLNACSHSGLVDEGLRYFTLMVNNYNIKPDQEVYGCAVDLLGRAGRVKEAYDLIQAMPFMPDESVWGAFLGACKAHKLADLGRLAASKVLDLRPSVAGTYLVLSNIYAADGKWGDVAKIRKLLRGMGNKKEAGRSWIEVRNEIYSFVAGDKLGSHIEWVYGAVDKLVLHMKEEGYDPDLQCLKHDFEDST